ncbi:MAG: hypothetical protein JRI92_11145 [Deltaproteobacteria bacterium]|nr:hypothetical protein [Deltaproteobacteria bacterium]
MLLDFPYPCALRLFVAAHGLKLLVAKKAGKLESSNSGLLARRKSECNIFYLALDYEIK